MLLQNNLISYDPSDFILPEDVSENLVASYESAGKVLRPFFGQTVSCGLFGIGDDHIEKYQSLDAKFVKNKASTFFFRASSNSMEPLIYENDVLVVDRSIEVRSNMVAIVSYCGEMYCKRIIKSASQVILRSDNPSYDEVLVTEDMNLIYFGVVRAVARELI